VMHIGRRRPISKGIVPGDKSFRLGNPSKQGGRAPGPNKDQNKKSGLTSLEGLFPLVGRGRPKDYTEKGIPGILRNQKSFLAKSRGSNVSLTEPIPGHGDGNGAWKPGSLAGKLLLGEGHSSKRRHKQMTALVKVGNKRHPRFWGGTEGATLLQFERHGKRCSRFKGVRRKP